MGTEVDVLRLQDSYSLNNFVGTKKINDFKSIGDRFMC